MENRLNAVIKLRLDLNNLSEALDHIILRFDIEEKQAKSEIKIYAALVGKANPYSDEKELNEELDLYAYMHANGYNSQQRARFLINRYGYSFMNALNRMDELEKQIK